MVDLRFAEGFAPLSRKSAGLTDVEKAALYWPLLLQADLRDLSQDSLTEGTVYFLIRRDDLARRDFSRVHGIDQKTRALGRQTVIVFSAIKNIRGA